jgi:hypothetical protein
MLRISWVAAQLTASQEELSSMSEWVEVKLETCMRMLFGSIADWITGCPDWGFLCAFSVHPGKFPCIVSALPIPVAARSKTWTLLLRSNTGVVGSNPTRNMDVCLRLFCVCVVLCVGNGLAMGWSPVQGVLPTAYRIKKMETRPESNKGLHSHRQIYTISSPLAHDCFVPKPFQFLELESLTLVSTEGTVFWDGTPCSQVELRTKPSAKFYRTTRRHIPADISLLFHHPSVSLLLNVIESSYWLLLTITPKSL